MNRNQITKQRGQGLLEFALIVPLLILLLAGILDLGRVTYYYSATVNSAREAARYGIIFPLDISGIISTAQDSAFGIVPDDVTITVDSDTDLISVAVTSSFTPALLIAEINFRFSPSICAPSCCAGVSQFASPV